MRKSWVKMQNRRSYQIPEEQQNAAFPGLAHTLREEAAALRRNPVCMHILAYKRPLGFGEYGCIKTRLIL